MNEYLKTFLTFLLGAGGLALINVVQERWKWKHERMAKKEDKKEEKEDKLDEISKQLAEFIKQQQSVDNQMAEKQAKQDKEMAAQSEALRYVLLDRILYIGKSYISEGEVTFDDRKRLREMHKCYHDGLNGNGDADQIMKAVDALPLKS